MDMFIAIITFGYMESITCFQVTDNILNTLMLTITYICFLLYLEKCQKRKQITDIYKMNTCLFHS